MKVDRILTTIDTHTEAGPTRIVLSGVPPLSGKNVAEKMAFFRTHYDELRKLLLWEPRGHKDLFGAVITEAADQRADIGVFFMTSAGYLATCVHSAIGVVVAGLETGFIQPAHDNGTVVLETPGGLLSIMPEYAGGRLVGVGLQMQPAFVYSQETPVTRSSGETLVCSIVHCGVFFALVDVAQIGLRVTPEGWKELVAVGVDVLDEANRSVEVVHPLDPANNRLHLILLYEEIDDRHARDIVINPSGGVDRSPCGAGTGALVTLRFVQSKLNLNQDYQVEGIIGTRFSGQVLQPANMESFPGAAPLVRGKAFVTGMHRFILDEDDALGSGFLLT